jgi:hypothetical protein
LEEVDI